MLAALRDARALAQEGGAPQPLLQFCPRTKEQRRVGPPEPAQDPARRARIGPGLGVAGGNLPAVGEAGLERRPRLPFDDHDFVAQLTQEPGAGDPDHTGAEDKDTHVADPQGSDCDRF